MGYAHHPFVTYLVGWDADRIIKAGTTHCQRWRKFCNLGARVELLHMTTETAWKDVYRLERALHEALWHLPPAFTTTLSAERHLGSGGGGYLECWQAFTEQQYRDALKVCDRMMRSHDNGHCATSLPALMHGRTDERTHVEPTYGHNHLAVCDARDFKRISSSHRGTELRAQIATRPREWPRNEENTDE